MQPGGIGIPTSPISTPPVRKRSDEAAGVEVHQAKAIGVHGAELGEEELIVGQALVSAGLRVQGRLQVLEARADDECLVGGGEADGLSVGQLLAGPQRLPVVVLLVHVGVACRVARDDLIELLLVRTPTGPP